MRSSSTALLSTAGVLIAVLLRLSPGVAQTPQSFDLIVDSYLERFAAYHPSIAAGNGLHSHDGELEDFSPASIAAEVEWLRATRQMLAVVDAASLTADQRVDQRILIGIVDGWLLDLDTVRTW